MSAVRISGVWSYFAACLFIADPAADDTVLSSAFSEKRGMEVKMHQALYRKYRPQTFDDVCGQEHITSVLKYEAANGRVSHAYLFCGSRGTGKTSCAKILAKAVNCENPHDGDPCGECAACRAIDSGAATDVIEMDAASNNGVDNIRELRDDIAYTPSMLKKRVYIIDEVHMLSVSAFNALLKTLEEPPEYVVFILATTELHKLPATIISRCQRFDFRRISNDAIVSRLSYIADCEGIRFEPDALSRIAKAAAGGMRDAVSLLELCAGGAADVNEDRVADVLGLSGYDMMKRFADAVAGKSVSGLIDMIEEVQSSSKDITVFWQEVISFWRDMMIMKVSSDPQKYLDLTDSESTVLKSCADRFSVNMLTNQSSVLDSAMKDMLRSPQTKTVIAEFASLRLTAPELDSTTDAMLARISELEDRVALLESDAVQVGAAGAEASLTLKKTSAGDTAVQKDGENTLSNGAYPAKEESASRSENVGSTAEHPESAEPESALEKNETRTDGGFEPVRDIQAVIDKLGAGADMYRSFLNEAEVSVNADSGILRISSHNAFAANILGTEQSKSLISKAALLAKVTDTLPTVEINIIRENTKKSSDDDIFG